MSHFISCFRNELQLYYKLRVTVLSESAIKHELCYLKRFDRYFGEVLYGIGITGKERRVAVSIDGD